MSNTDQTEAQEMDTSSSPKKLADKTNNNNNDSSNSESEPQQQPSVRLRGSRPPPMNGLASNAVVTNGDAHSAIMRGMGALQESQQEQEFEEIHKLDRQLDHLNDYMGKVEKRIAEHHEKLTTQLEQQREEREKRRQSFHERQKKSVTEDMDFHSQVMAMLGRCQEHREQNDDNAAAAASADQ